MNRKRARKLASVFILLGLILFFSAASRAFWSASNIVTVLRQISLLGVTSLGLMCVLLSGCVDLSIGAQMSFTGILFAIFLAILDMPLVPALLLSILAGALTGYLNGLIVTRLGIPSLLSTLAVTSVLNGLAYILCGGRPVYGIPEILLWVGQGHVATIPVPVLILAALALAFAFVLKKTYFGMYLYAVGANEPAAYAAGIDTARVKRICYVLSGLMAAIAGIIMVSRVNSGQPAAGNSFQMNTLTACTIGGISLSGGEGKVANVLIGVLVVGVLTNGLGILGVSKHMLDVSQGVILLFALGMDYQQRGRSGEAARSSLLP